MSTWKKVCSVAVWIAVNAVMWGLAIAGTAMGIHWAFNIWAFLTWFWVVCYVLIFIIKVATPQDYDALDISPRSTGPYVPIISDVAMAIMMAAFGHWFYAWLVLIQQLCESVIFAKPKIKAS